jgi:hypothetical protein
MFRTTALPNSLCPQRSIFLVMFICLAPCTYAEKNSQSKPSISTAVTAIPAIEDLASDWLDVSQINHMPSLHNFHEMAACAPNLLTVNYIPGRRLFVYPVTTRWYIYYTLPVVKLLINGQAYESTTCRWYPYQAVRRRAIDQLEVETTVRMVFEGPGILYRVQATNGSTNSQSVDLAIEIFDGVANTPKEINDLTVQCYSKDPQIELAYAFVNDPESVVSSESSVIANWHPTLQAGESVTIEFVMAHTLEESDTAITPISRTALQWANDFEGVWKTTKTAWAQRWRDAFTPGNEHFSGSLPTLVTSDEKISDIYYRSILTLLVLHRTNLKMNDRVFITSGEREKGYVFYWDTSMWSKIFALLEPEGMKIQLRLFLQADPHGGFVYNMQTGTQGDGWYAANDMTMFRLVNSYLAVTGDNEFLREKVGDRSVLEHMEKLALGWQELQQDKSVMLADYGENENLLECAPRYVHRVPSFNAANVWMMRTVANIQQQHGNPARAKQFRQWADQIAAAVLDLYKPGDGVWNALHRDGKRVELRHCYDFVCIGKFITADLSPKIKREMVDFVERELLTDKWMRAMSPKDKAAEISDRPDHGPMGAFDAWPALTADTMCKLGAWKKALDFIHSTQAVLYEGVYAQAREFYGPNRLQNDAPVRIALRGACMRECVGGGAFAEMIVGALFGFDPEFGPEFDPEFEPSPRSDLQLRDSGTDRGFEGTLVNLPYRGILLDISSDNSGVRAHVRK